MDSINKLSRLTRRMNRKASFTKNILKPQNIFTNQLVIKIKSDKIHLDNKKASRNNLLIY
ncbi:hypothetical protein TMM008_33890 [Pseudomonas sp. 008]|nr:hypothetical protein TMM008_33890 [Pseudomonas sp. 008]